MIAYVETNTLVWFRFVGKKKSPIYMYIGIAYMYVGVNVIPVAEDTRMPDTATHHTPHSLRTLWVYLSSHHNPQPAPQISSSACFLSWQTALLHSQQC